jgi:hypothetical protein
MKDFFKGKFFTILTITVTVILAGVAIFTAISLYQLRQESVSPASPESEPAAWDCHNYTFSLSATGIVSVSNSSSRNEPPQQAQVYIDNQLVTTLDVPALPAGQSATLGTVSVPAGTFSWKILGTVDCQNSGTITSAPVACTQLKFTITTTTVTPSPSEEVEPTVTPTTTSTPTPTDKPLGGEETTPTPTPQATATPTPTQAPQQIAAQITPAPGGHILPDAGISTPTLFGLSLGILIIVAAVLLAF